MTSKQTTETDSRSSPSKDSNTEDPPKKPRGRPRRKKSSRRRQISRNFNAEEKARAVLAAWTEKLSQSEICRQLKINYVTFQNWQKRAMEGMLQALEDHARLTDGAALSPRLRKLMERQRSTPEPKLEERLRRIQEGSDKTASE